MKKWLVTVEVTTGDDAAAQNVADYFDDALAEQGDRVSEDNGYDWDATDVFISTAKAVARA